MDRRRFLNRHCLHDRAWAPWLGGMARMAQRRAAQLRRDRPRPKDPVAALLRLQQTRRSPATNVELSPATNGPRQHRDQHPGSDASIWCSGTPGAALRQLASGGAMASAWGGRDPHQPPKREWAGLDPARSRCGGGGPGTCRATCPGRTRQPARRPGAMYLGSSLYRYPTARTSRRRIGQAVSLGLCFRLTNDDVIDLLHNRVQVGGPGTVVGGKQ